MSSNSLLSWLLELWPVLFGGLLSRLPTLLVEIGGAIYAAMNLRRAPAAAGFVLAGCVALALSGFVAPVFYHFMFRSGSVAGGNPAALQVMSGMLSLFNAVALALIVVGAFAGRPRMRNP